MDIVGEVLEKVAKQAEQFKTIVVDKPLDLDYCLGTLLAEDTNDLDLKQFRSSKEEYLKSLTRDNTQLLFNKIWELPTERVDEAIVVKLPPPTFILPREKPLPKLKQLTKWQKFAQEKGIKKTKKSKLAWDDILQKWVPHYGFKRSQAQKEKDWLMEVPRSSDPFQDQFKKQVNTKQEKVAKNEFQRLRNLAASKNIKVPRIGLSSSEHLNAKQLGAAVTIAKASTASVGKFQSRLPKEKQAKKIGALLPSGRKRKLPPLAPEQEKKSNINILNNILNKRPKLNIEKAVNRELHQEQQEKFREKSQKPNKGRGKKRQGGGSSKKGKGAGKRPAAKPAGGKGKRGPRQNTGRKRR